MTRDCHVRFREQLGVKIPRLTRLADTTKGADASAIIYSVVCSAKANGIDVHSYLTFLLTELPKLYAKSPRNPDLSPFLPWNFNP